MARTKTTVVGDYEVTNNDSVIISIKVGFGQPSRTFIRVDGNVVHETTDSEFDFDLGIPNSQKGKVLKVRVVIRGFQPSTDESSVIIILKGGVTPFANASQNTISPKGGTITYNYQFTFI